MSPAPPRRALDWSLGRYEHTAEQLLPAARAVVEHAAPAKGQHVVDIGCGTGNAALLAAERGARVTVERGDGMVWTLREASSPGSTTSTTKARRSKPSGCASSRARPC